MPHDARHVVENSLARRREQRSSTSSRSPRRCVPGDDAERRNDAERQILDRENRSRDRWLRAPSCEVGDRGSRSQPSLRYGKRNSELIASAKSALGLGAEMQAGNSEQERRRLRLRRLCRAHARHGPAYWAVRRLPEQRSRGSTRPPTNGSSRALRSRSACRLTCSGWNVSSITASSSVRVARRATPRCGPGAVHAARRPDAASPSRTRCPSGS